MWFLNPRRVVFPCVCIALAFVFNVSVSNAQQATKVSGTISAAYTHQDTVVVGDEPGHLFSLALSEGKNVGATEQAMMGGAQVVNMAHSDLLMGNGTQRGYIRFAQDSDTTFANWQGKVTTTLAEDGTPVTTMEGTFSYIKGTGQFVNIKGNGTYKGKLTSKTSYTVEWQGEYSIGE
jgi:hypothetical protein